MIQWLAYLWRICHISYSKLEGEGVDGDGVLSCMHLKDTSQEALREEESGKPEARGLPLG